MQSKYKSTLCNLKGTLAEPLPGNPSKYHKFCATCGYQLVNEARKLKNHCNHYHDGENKGFLLHGEIPPKPIYLNFDRYLEGSDVDLILGTQVKLNMGGRPKDNDKIAKVDKLIESIENKLKTDNDEKNQKERELNTNI